MRNFGYYLWLFVVVLLNTAVASPLLVLSNDSSQIEMVPYTEFAEDTERAWGVADLQLGDKAFTSKSGEFVNFGFSKSTHWLRFTVLNRSQNKHWYLDAGGALGRQVTVYAEENGAFSRQEKMKWSMSNRYHLMLDVGKETTVYLQIYDPQGLVIVSPMLYSMSAAIDSISYNNAFFAFLMTGLLVLAAYNLLYYIHLRDSAFLTLSVFITAVAFCLGNYEGLLSFFPWSTNNLAWFGVSFSFVAIMSGLRLAISLLDVRQQLPKMIIWYDLGSLLCLILVVVSLIFGYGLLIGSLLGVYCIALVLVTLFKLSRQGYVLPKSLLLSIFIFLSAGSPLLLTVIGVVEYYPSIIAGFFVATLVSLLVLSLTQAEKIRLKSEYLERTAAANQAKDEFLTTMSHELRTPMNAVVGAGRLLGLTPLSKDQAEYVDRLNDVSGHMLSLVNDLLDLARVDSQLLQLEKIPFELEEVQGTLRQLLNESAASKQLELTLDICKLPANKSLVGDSTRLNQVLLNLLGNAIKFTHSGKVSLKVSLVDIGVHQASLYFSVADTGIGLTKAQQDGLFLPFTQAESSTSRQYGGSGLGLAISQKLVKRMGGNLIVSSEPKRGSCFSFTLSFPLESQSVMQEKKPQPLRDSLQGVKILLVDDDEMNRFFGKKLLEVSGVDVVVAESGEMAISLLQQQTFSLVFMDISMPVIDGYESTRRIRRIPELKNLIVIALTAHAVAGERERCLAAGMNDYLTKPFELDDLQDMIFKWFVKPSNSVSSAERVIETEQYPVGGVARTG